VLKISGGVKVDMGEAKWSKTAQVASRFAREFAKRLVIADEGTFETDLLEARRRHGEALVEKFRSEFPAIDLEGAWQRIERSRDEFKVLIDLGRETLSRFIDATAWGYTKDGTYDKSRFVIERLSKPLGMTQEEVWSCISVVTSKADCPVCGMSAVVSSPCAPLSSYRHPTRIACQSCGHHDVLGRAPSTSSDLEPRMFGERLTCACDRCARDRKFLGAEAAKALREAIAKDVEGIWARSRETDWMMLAQDGELYGREDSWDGGAAQKGRLDLMIEEVQRNGGVRSLDAARLKKCLEVAAGRNYKGLGRSEAATSLFIASGIEDGWLVLQSCSTPAFEGEGRRMALDGLYEYLRRHRTEFQTLEHLVCGVEEGKPEAVLELPSLTGYWEKVGASVVAEVAFDPDREAYRAHFDRARAGRRAAEDRAVQRRAQVPVELVWPPQTAATSGPQLASRSRASGQPVQPPPGSRGATAAREETQRKPTVRGMGWRAHMASHERLLVTAKAAIPTVVHDDTTDGVWVAERAMDSEAFKRFVDDARRIIGLPRDEIEHAVLAQIAVMGAKEGNGFEVGFMQLGKNLMERKGSGSSGTRDVVSMRADFELSFSAPGFEVQLSKVTNLGPRVHVDDLRSCVQVRAMERMFRVAGCVLGSGVRVGQAVDEMADLALACREHYDIQRRVDEGMTGQHAYAGHVMFVTDDKTIFDMLVDQYDGVLLGYDGVPLDVDFESVLHFCGARFTYGAA
jgi:hypothetical protein